MRTFIQKYRWAVATATLALAVVAFLAFRPDKLFVDDVVDESLTDAFAVAATQPPVTADGGPTTMEAPTTAPAETSAPDETTTTTTTTQAPGPAPAYTGGFYGIGHSAGGTATVYEQDGTYVLRLEDDTDIQNGPDLFVWLLPTDDYDRSAIGEHIDLGKLKGNVGGQNYELPDTFDPAVHRSVLIWCERFSVPFAAVSLADA